MLGKRKGKQKRRASDGASTKAGEGSSSAGTSGKVAAEVKATLGRLRLRKGAAKGPAAKIVPNEEKLGGWKENRYLRRSFLDEVSMRPRRSGAGKQTTKTTGGKKPADGTGPTTAEAVEALTTLLKGPVKSVNVLFVGPSAEGEQSADGDEDEERMRTWSTLEHAAESDFNSGDRDDSSLVAIASDRGGFSTGRRHGGLSRRERATHNANAAPPTPLDGDGKMSEWATAAWKSAAASGIERTKAVEQVAAFERDNAPYFEVLAECELPDDYAGPTPKCPPTLEDMEEMYAAFRDGKRLHQKFMLAMLLSIKLQWTCHKPDFKGQVSQTLIDLPDPPEGSRMVIVGDTHGQLQDVLWIFENYGFPSETNIYLFNGDVADRGTQASEIFALIFGFMLLQPSSIYLSRGNHEDEGMNARPLRFGGGFEEECVDKFGWDTFDLFMDLFELLPLTYVIAKKALVVHAGIPRQAGVHLSQLRRLDAKYQCPKNPQSFDEFLFFDCLWSDPHPSGANGVHQSDRGKGTVLFGKDVLLEFLHRNSLQLVIRSHELPQDGHGYEVLADGKCITVFSASNYGGNGINAGAVLLWEKGKIDAHEHIAPTTKEQAEAAKKGAAGMDKLRRRYLSSGDQWEEETGSAPGRARLARLDDEIVLMLKERICRHKHELSSKLLAADTLRDGTVTVETWCGVMSDVLHIDINYKKYRKRLVEVDDDGRIGAKQFLDRYQVRLREQYAGWQHSVLQAFYNSLLAADLQLNELLAFVDSDGDGRISRSECVDALMGLKLGLTNGQTRQLISTLGFETRAKGDVPKAGDGEPTIDVELFLARLTKAAHTAKPKSEAERRHLEQVAGWIEQRSTDSSKSLSAIFREWDSDGDGYISYDEFVACCMACQAGAKGGAKAAAEGTDDLAEDDFVEIAKAIDTGATTGRISYLAFLSVLQVLPGGDLHRVERDANRALIDFICSVIWANEVTLSKAFRLFDPKQTGVLAPADFQKAVASMNDVLASPFEPLTQLQIDTLVSALPLGSKGEINYKQFLESFEVVDMPSFEA